MATSRAPRWTAKELDTLVAMAGHASNIEIADELGRTKDSVAYQISVRKIRTDPTAINNRGAWSTKPTSEETCDRIERMMQLAGRCA